jgi:hypothetical protein
MLSPFFFPVNAENFNFVRLVSYLLCFTVLVNVLGERDLWERDFVRYLVLVLHPSGEMAPSGTCPQGTR